MATKDYSYHKRFKFADNQSEYVFQLKRRNWKWLWLLLLPLLLLLLVRCEKDIKVHAVDNLSGENIPDVEVTLAYTAHYLYKNGSLFYEENIVRSLRTDSLGCGRFSDLPCSVFSYIFYALSKATYEVADQCHLLKSNLELSLFHYTWHKPLDMLPKTVDLPLIVMDRETKEPLPGAHLEYEYVIGGENHLDSVITTANGKCSLKAVPECGQIVFNKVSCYGYADTVDIKMNVSMALARTDSSQILLTPLKQRFTYFVKNKFTRQPVPGATVEVVLTSSNGKIIRGESVTNVNGKGLGVYEDAFVLAEVDLKAYKKHYKEGKLDKIYKVEQFAALPEEGRTVYIEPLPYLEQFQNVDSITGVPLASVANDIHIASINGQDEKSLEISNRNGVFYVKAMEGDEINIHSELPPLYKPQDTHIEKFSTGKIIKMEPVKTDLKFRTIDGDLNELLPQCTLSITTSCSNVEEPQSSGNGEFVVEDIFLTEDISIVASKNEYTTNADKIRNAQVFDLMNAPQEERDIPLFIQLPPCNAGAEGTSDVAAGTVSRPYSYNMGTLKGTFEITFDTGNNCPDCIDIYNHHSNEDYRSGVKIFSTGQVATDGDITVKVPFSSGSVITVIVTTGPEDGSLWNYHISCPQ